MVESLQYLHPLVLQIKQRHSWKPKLLVWAGIYGGIAGAIALWLFWQRHDNWSLPGIYGAVLVAAIVDGVSVRWRQQKSVFNELVTFAAVCLAAPLAYVATVGTLSTSVIALWLLNTLFFSSAIFTVKLRKARTASVTAGAAFHASATALVVLMWQAHWLAPGTAAAFGIALLKFGLILWQRDWYCNTQIQSVAMLETGASFLFLVVAALSQLPAHLS